MIGQFLQQMQGTNTGTVQQPAAQQQAPAQSQTIGQTIDQLLGQTAAPDPAPAPTPVTTPFSPAPFTATAELGTTVQTGNGQDNAITNGGNDTINAGTGNDTINAGDGNDVINAGPGNDTIVGGEGNDVFVAGQGDTIVIPGIGSFVVNNGQLIAAGNAPACFQPANNFGHAPAPVAPAPAPATPAPVAPAPAPTPAPVAPAPTPAPAVPTEPVKVGDAAKVWGDPHFIGAEGGRYDIKGDDNAVYNLLSDHGVQVNSTFKGNLMQDYGVTVGNNQISFNKAGELKINGEVVKGNEEFLDGMVTRKGSDVTIKAGEYEMTLSTRGNHMDIAFKSDNVAADGIMPESVTKTV